MRRFKTFASINEASLMKPDYVIGHKVVWKGTDFAELGKLGYTKGDVFEIVSGGKVEVSVGKETGEIEKFIKGPDGKVIRLKADKAISHLPSLIIKKEEVFLLVQSGKTLLYLLIIN